MLRRRHIYHVPGYGICAVYVLVYLFDQTQPSHNEQCILWQDE